MLEPKLLQGRKRRSHAANTLITGSAGLLTGGITSVIRSSPTPTLFALASSIQWFLLGSTFSATRTVLLQTLPQSSSSTPTTSFYTSPATRLQASTLAGSITGFVVAAITRGRRNVIPATLFWGAAGWAGQKGYIVLDERHNEQSAARLVSGKEVGTDDGFWKWVADMGWSPMRALTDEEYGGMLKEKLLAVEVQIRSIDGEIERLKGEEKRANIVGEEKKTGRETNPGA